MPQPYADPTNLTTVMSIAKYSNDVVNGMFFMLVLVALTIVLFTLFVTKFNKLSDSATVAFFLGLVLGAIMWAADLIAGKLLVLWLVGTVACLIWSMFDKRY